ncbi:MAG: AAA family ATPase, partial [Alphaproteobacteria bacterium]
KTKTGVYDIDGTDSAVEVLGEGQQFVASGIHPDTLKPYRWPDDSLIDLTPSDLTAVTPEQLHTFLDGCRNILGRAGTLKGRVSERSPAVNGTSLILKELDGEMREIEAALAFLPNDDEHYDDWIGTLHAIKGALGDDGRELAHRWSKRSDKYDEAEADRAWDSIKDVKHIGAGSIYHWASQYGFDLREIRNDAKEEVKQEAAQEAVKGRILSLGQLASLPPPTPLVDGLIFRNTLVNVFGPPASFKSFLALDIGLSVAHGGAWHGREVHSGPVLYIAGEGAAGIRKRASAWMQNHGVADNGEPFFVLPQAVAIRDDAEVDALIAEAGETMPQPPTLVIIDTLARSFGGGDENSGEAMGEFIAGCDRIRTAFDGATVMIIHHAGKDTTRGARGHSSLYGAVDTELELKRSQGSDSVTIRNSKQKDAEEADGIRMTARVVTLPPGDNLWLEEETSVVLDYDDAPEMPDREKKLGGNQRVVMQQLERAVEQVGEAQFIDGAERKVITADAAKRYAYMVLPKGDGKDNRWTNYSRAITTLRDRGLVGFYNDYFWINR